jgi:uncharacterized FlgJ-related protein
MKKTIIILAVFLIAVLPYIQKQQTLIQTAKAEAKQVQELQVQEFKDPDEEKLVNYFKTHKEMRQIAPYIVRACKKENVDIKLITAIAILESGWGTSRIAKEKKNYFGLSCYDWDPSGSALDFSQKSIENAILESVKIIKRDYLSNNWTIEQIGQKYCPTNPRWAKIIKEIIEEIDY